MLNGKTIIILLLMAFIILSPMTLKAEGESPNYIEFNGIIKEVNKGDGRFSILVERELKEGEEGTDKLIGHINEEVLLLDDNNLNIIPKENLKEGINVSMYYHKDTVMAMSYPGQLSPDVVVIKNKDKGANIIVDSFNHNFTSNDGSLKLNIKEDTEVINREGKRINKEDGKNKDLVNFFNHDIMEDYPGEINPQKVIILKDNKPKTMDKIVINGKEIKLTNSIYENKEKAVMIPLRQISEELGYKVKWNQKDLSAELTKGPQWTQVFIGKDHYNFAKMLIKLGVEPELKNEKTFVPISFLKEVLRVEYDYTVDGVLNINSER